MKYFSDLMASSYVKGDNYHHHTCYSVWFLNYDLFEDNEIIHTFTMKDENSNELLKTKDSIIIIEIEKLKNYNKVDIWEQLFYVENYNSLMGVNKVMDKLIDDIYKYNENDNMRDALFYQERDREEREADLAAAKRNGFNHSLSPFYNPIIS